MDNEYLKGDLTIGLGYSYATKTKHREPYLKFYREHLLIAKIYFHSAAQVYVIATSENIALTKATLKELMDFMNIDQFRLYRRWAESKIKNIMKG